VAAGLITVPKTQTNLFDDEKERWRSSGTSRPCRNSPPPMPRSTIISTRTVTLSVVMSSRKTDPLPWPSGVNSPRESLRRFRSACSRPIGLTKPCKSLLLTHSGQCVGYFRLSPLFDQPFRTLCRQAESHQWDREFWNQAKRQMRKYYGVSKANFGLFLKECGWRLINSDPSVQLSQLR